MELSNGYVDTMRRLSYGQSTTVRPGYPGTVLPISLRIEVNPEGCTIPLFIKPTVARLLIENGGNPFTLVVPLDYFCLNRNYTSTDPILKGFTRYRSSGILTKVCKSEEEFYYGGNGMIFDRDCSPLLLSTVKIKYDTERMVTLGTGVEIHLHPKVFIDTDSIITKSLAKKGMCFFLTQFPPGVENTQVRVVIDDSSEFVTKINHVDANDSTNDSLNLLLKDNIDEVLTQIVNDFTRDIR
jgi:hypothetical protein